MVRRKRKPAFDYRKKNRKKFIKTVMQMIILLAVGFAIYNAVFDIRKYNVPDQTRWANEKGFIALSYFGVDRAGTPKLVAKKQLNEQLEALYDQGYITISQQDIIDFYTKGKALPDKALFLAFEDGRNDSSLFAQPLLEKYNFKATFLSYANKLNGGNPKFVQPKDMLKMMNTGYWELGSNGYRLTYINIFDDDGRYIGVKDENELPNKEKVAYYNHYLMDFIRDENMIPMENRSVMEKRISADYMAMKDIYNKSFGFVPQVYMIMHANALYGGMNKLVADVNSENIENLFTMHFNREGYAFNTSEDNLFNLTRVQPSPYWYTNHLLMRIQSDTEQKLNFVHGDEQQAEQWTSISGAAQFIDNRLALTSPPAEAGTIYLNNSEEYQDVKFKATIAGNVIGKQTLYARYDHVQDSFVRITIENNELRVSQKKSGYDEQLLFSSKLNAINWNAKDLSLSKATVYTNEQTKSGASSDELEYPINVQQTRQIEVVVLGDALDVSIDGEALLTDQVIDNSIKGGLALESEYSEQNRKDDIYDAVFDDVQIVSLSGNDKNLVVYSNKQTGIQIIVRKIREVFNGMIDWAVTTL